MLRVVMFVLQTIVFLVAFAVGSVLLPLLPAIPVWQVQTGPGRAFVFDGVILAGFFYVLILAIEAARKRLRSAGLVTTGALVVALALGLLMRFGFKSL